MSSVNPKTIFTYASGIRATNSTTSGLEADLNSSRTTVNQITFAILISILVVADMFLVWSLGYIVIYYEQRVKQAVEYYFNAKLNRRRSSIISS